MVDNFTGTQPQTNQKLGNFTQRHIGPNPDDIEQMLDTLGISNLDDLIDKTVPQAIRFQQELKLPAAQSEYAALAKLKQIADKNQVYRSFIGMGYYDCITPAVIQRNILENPGWYTAYTPY
ncbi:MAG: glycine dehydrogenase (aminomethyl-transferring), partial [Dolichospermum sp.]